MKYAFFIQKISKSTVYSVKIEDSAFRLVGYFTDVSWTPKKVEEIIDKIEANKNLEKTEDPYVWGNEDITVFANELGVLLVDKIAMRAKQEAEPLELIHDEFIIFMKDFKKFIEENS